MEKYHSSGLMGSSFNGFGTFWWDPKAQVYRRRLVRHHDARRLRHQRHHQVGRRQTGGHHAVGYGRADDDDDVHLLRLEANSFVMTMEMGPTPIP